MDINKRTGETVRRLREASSISLSDLARMIHKSKSSVSKYESGIVGMDLETLYDIAAALGVSVRELLFSEGAQADKEQQTPIRLLHSVADETTDEVVLQMYLYFYGGELSTVREALLEVNRLTGDTRMYCDPYHKKGGIGFSFLYTGETVYFDSKYRMTLYNHFDKNDIFIIQWADALTGSTTLMGLMSHFAAGQFNSFSTKALLTKSRMRSDDSLKSQLAFSKEEIKTLRKRNALYGSTRPQDNTRPVNNWD